MTNAIKLLLILCSTLAAIGITFGAYSDNYSVESLFIYGLTGVFLGAIMAPELAPEHFRYPVIWQTLFSTSTSLLLAYSFNLSGETFTFVIIIGFLSGLTANLWLKHVKFP